MFPAGAPADSPQRAGTVIACSVSTRRRSRGGSTCTTLPSAHTDASSIPGIAPSVAACIPTASATASSSSTVSGGRALPARSW
jgi:hypothetical protein